MEIDNETSLIPLTVIELELESENVVLKKRRIPKTQVFYIASTNCYKKKHIYKIGGVDNESLLKPRKITYNAGRPSEDRLEYENLFYCFDYKLIENTLFFLLSNFKLENKKEMYQVNKEVLLEIINKVIEQHDELVFYTESNQKIWLDKITKINDSEEKNNDSFKFENTKNCDRWLTIS